MIIGVVGGIGTGKSTSAVRMMLRSPYPSYTNMNVKGAKVIRLHREDIITTEEVDKKVKYSINWDFWNRAREEHGNLGIYLDEVGNLFSSRLSTSRWNVKAIDWVSQVRKLLGQDEKSNLVLVVQKLMRLDKGFRDLMHLIIKCEKHVISHSKVETKVLDEGRIRIKMLPEIYIEQRFFYGAGMFERYENSGSMKTWNSRSMFYANPIFKHFDSYQIFGESGYL